MIRIRYIRLIIADMRVVNQYTAISLQVIVLEELADTDCIQKSFAFPFQSLCVL